MAGIILRVSKYQILKMTKQIKYGNVYMPINGKIFRLLVAPPPVALRQSSYHGGVCLVIRYSRTKIFSFASIY